MKVLVTFAVEAEFASWKRRLELRASERSGVKVYSASVGGAGVDFAVTGMGRIHAAQRGEILLNEQYDLCIASGFAGALHSKLAVADVIAPRAVREFESNRIVNADAGFVATAATVGVKTIDSLVSLHRVAATPADKARLAPIADACDMESFAILSAAESRGIPAIAIRAISDSSNDSIPLGVDALINRDGRVSVPGVVKFAASRPLAMPSVIRLGRKSKAAAESLADHLESFIGKLAQPLRARLSEELQGAAR